MINYQLNLVSLCGLFLIILGIFLLFSGIGNRRKLVRNVILSFAYGYSGYILIFEAWRFTLPLQLGVVILTGANISWAVNEDRQERSDRPE